MNDLEPSKKVSLPHVVVKLTIMSRQLCLNTVEPIHNEVLRFQILLNLGSILAVRKVGMRRNRTGLEAGAALIDQSLKTKLRLNLSTTGTLRTEESGHCRRRALWGSRPII